MSLRMEVSMTPYPGGCLFLSEKERTAVYRSSYISTESSEEDIHFGHDYVMEISDYIEGLEELRKKGSCSIPISKKNDWYPRLCGGPIKHPGTVDMELIDGKVRIYGQKTSWTLEQINPEDIGKR